MINVLLPVFKMGEKHTNPRYRPYKRFPRARCLNESTGNLSVGYPKGLKVKRQTYAGRGGTKGEFDEGFDEGLESGRIAGFGQFAHVAVADAEEDDAGGADGKAGEHGDTANLDVSFQT